MNSSIDDGRVIGADDRTTAEPDRIGHPQSLAVLLNLWAERDQAYVLSGAALTQRQIIAVRDFRKTEAFDLPQGHRVRAWTVANSWHPLQGVQ